MKFNYQARTEDGDAKTGTVEAVSYNDAVEVLQKYGLYVTVLEEVHKAPLYARKIKLFERVSSRDIVLFSRQLSIMFGSMVSLTESLRTLAYQTGNANFKEKIIKISEDIEAGQPLSFAFSRHPKLFSPFFTAMIRAGEASGKLSYSLDYLAQHLERTHYIKSKIRGAMIYPALVTLLAAGIMGLMIFFIIPKFQEVLEGFGQELPLLTRAVISFSDFFRAWFLFLAAGFAASLFLVLRFYGSSRGKIFFDRNFLRIPVFGSFLKMLCLSRFSENLSTLISGGLPIAKALEITGDIVGNSAYGGVIAQAQDAVKKGEPISSVLFDSPEFFPPVFTQMVLIGEKTGSLDKSMLNVSEFYRKEIDFSVENILNVLEPLLIIFLGLGVGLMMASILLPLYKTSGI